MKFLFIYLTILIYCLNFYINCAIKNFKLKKKMELINVLSHSVIIMVKSVNA